MKTVLIGQQSEVTNRFVGKDFLVFQVVFSPGGLYRSCYVDAETIFAKHIKEVNDKLNDASTCNEMVLEVEWGNTNCFLYGC